MKRNTRTIVGVAVLTVFGVLAFLNFNKTIAPYVPFAEARASSGAVQVAGFPDHQRARFDPSNGLFSFDMSDEEGDVMTVNFTGVKPGNFDQAEKVVVVGRYEDGALNASQILVKCPSKYDDLASEEYKSYEATGSTSGETAP
jgi:cytochrome c-type biogenesis protein CcmE